MPMWPFSKKKSDSQSDEAQDLETRNKAEERSAADGTSAADDAAQSDASAALSDAPSGPEGFKASCSTL